MIRPNFRRPAVQPGKWLIARSGASSLGLLLGIGLLMVWMLEVTGVRQYIQMTQELEKTREDILALEEANAALREQIHLVDADLFTLEKLSRERLGYVKEGEVVYQFVDSTSPTPDRGASE